MREEGVVPRNGLVKDLDGVVHVFALYMRDEHQLILDLVDLYEKEAVTCLICLSLR